jgi:hypothetical protein
MIGLSASEINIFKSMLTLQNSVAVPDAVVAEGRERLQVKTSDSAKDYEKDRT